MVVNPMASADTIVAEINPAFLLKGTNKLVLTAIDEPAERDDFTGTDIVYDAIALEQNPDAHFDKGRVAVEVTPTIFYVRKGEGVTELVDVLVRCNQALASGQLTLKLGAQTFTQKLSADREFGEEVAEFAVPDFPQNTPAEVTAKNRRQDAALSLHGQSREEVAAVRCPSRAPGCGVLGLPSEGQRGAEPRA